jgi:hypothetical protein
VGMGVVEVGIKPVGKARDGQREAVGIPAGRVAHAWDPQWAAGWLGDHPVVSVGFVFEVH